jgi:hypothetical protein
MSEWRTLPEFPKYEITSDGDVRNRESKKVLKEMQNSRTGAWAYSLRRNDGRSTQRNFWSLVYSAWPEYKPEDPKELAIRKPANRYSKRGQWADIPGFPTYEAHPDGSVRYKKTRKRRSSKINKRNEVYYPLYNEYGDRSDVKVKTILVRCFGELAEAA